jgi:hypothetical protein
LLAVVIEITLASLGDGKAGGDGNHEQEDGNTPP